MNIMRILTIVSTLVGFTLIPVTFSWSQDLALEEVVVTARKRQESLLEVPESISSFSSSVIESGNLRSLKDISLIVPNLYMSTRLDGFPNVSMRGMGAFGNTAATAADMITGKYVLLQFVFIKSLFYQRNHLTLLLIHHL